MKHRCSAQEESPCRGTLRRVTYEITASKDNIQSRPQLPGLQRLKLNMNLIAQGLAGLEAPDRQRSAQEMGAS